MKMKKAKENSGNNIIDPIEKNSMKLSLTIKY